MTIQDYSMMFIRLMDAVEDVTGKMFQETHGPLEHEIWNAIDANDIIKVKVLHSQLCTIVDAMKEAA